MKKLSLSRNYYLVQTPEEIQDLIIKYDSYKFVAFDTETTGVNPRQDKIIGFSFSFEKGTGYYVPIYSWIDNQLVPHRIVGSKKLIEFLSTKDLIMHNASFDTRIVFNNFGIDMLKNLHADTMLMRHTLNEEGPFGLKEIAIELSTSIGMSKDDVANQEQLKLEENVLSKGGAWKKTQKDMYMADLDILAEYACADTDLTLRLYQHFNKELSQQNLSNFFYKEEVMPLYKLVTIPMEHNGVPVNMERLNQLIADIKKDIESLEKSITDSILNSEEGKKFVDFRCEEEIEIKPTGKFAQAVAEYYQLPLPKSESGKYSITKKNLEKLVDTPIKFFLQGQVVEAIPQFKEVQLNILKEEGPLININSKTQLGKLIFDVMGVKPLTTTDKGSPQFNEDFVEHLAEKGIVSWASDLRVYNKLVKIFGSSYERFSDEQENGVFYPYFKQHGTTSGRYSSNLQQLPRPLEEGGDHPLIVKYTNEIRALFIPKEGHIFIDDDYESLEPRCFADDAGDPSLIEIFEKGEDFYSKVAIMTEGLKNVSAHKKDENFLKNVAPDKRQSAKSYSLGIRYGMKSGKLSKELNCTKEEAQEKIDSYFKAFPNLKKAMDGYLHSVKTKGIVVNSFGRVRHLPEAQQIYKSFGDDILDYTKTMQIARYKKLSFQEVKDISKKYNNLLNNALNFPIQSKAASLVNRAAIAMSTKFLELELDAYVIAQIHDEIIVSCDTSIKDEVAKIVQDCMENANKLSMKLIAKPEFSMNFRDGK